MRSRFCTVRNVLRCNVGKLYEALIGEGLRGCIVVIIVKFAALTLQFKTVAYRSLCKAIKSVSWEVSLHTV